MSVNSEKESVASGHNFELGIAGFRFSDLFDAVKLAELSEVFYSGLQQSQPVVGEALRKYLETDGKGYERRAAS